MDLLADLVFDLMERLLSEADLCALFVYELDWHEDAETIYTGDFDFEADVPDYLHFFDLTVVMFLDLTFIALVFTGLLATLWFMFTDTPF